MSNRQTFALPFLLLTGLPAQDPADDPVARAIAAMRAQGRPGLCFVVPRDRADLRSLTPKQQQALILAFRTRLRGLALPMGKLTDDYVAAIAPTGTVAQQFATSLHHLLLTTDMRTLVLLQEAVLVTAPAERVGARSGENLVLLDDQGKRIDGAQADLLDDAAFTAAAERLLHADGRLEQRIARTATEEITAKVAAASGADDAARTAAAQWLAVHWNEAVPAIAGAMAKVPGEQRARLDESVRTAVASTVGQDRDGLLPFGAKWEQLDPAIDPCPPCGMARVSAPARRLLRLLAD